MMKIKKFNMSGLLYGFSMIFKCSGVSNHSIKLKVGVPIMLLRNINQENV